MVLGVHVGDVDAGMAAWAPFRALAEPVADLVGPMPYPAIYQFTAEGQARGGGSIRSWFTDDVDVADAGTIVDLMRHAPSPAVITQIRVLGGAMARVAPEDTAFSQRDAEVLVAAMALFEIDGDPAPSDAWTTAFFAAFVDSMTGRVRELPRGRGRGPDPGGVPARRLRVPRRDQAPLRPGERVPAQPEHPAGLTAGSAGRPGGDERRWLRARAAASSSPGRSRRPTPGRAGGARPA